jgi:hypothetical protein
VEEGQQAQTQVVSTPVHAPLLPPEVSTLWCQPQRMLPFLSAILQFPMAPMSIASCGLHDMPNSNGMAEPSCC